MFYIFRTSARMNMVFLVTFIVGIGVGHGHVTVDATATGRLGQAQFVEHALNLLHAGAHRIQFLRDAVARSRDFDCR